MATLSDDIQRALQARWVLMGLQPKDFYERLDIGPQFASVWMSGNPTMRTLQRLSLVFALPASDILGGRDKILDYPLPPQGWHLNLRVEWFRKRSEGGVFAPDWSDVEGELTNV